MTTFLDRLRCWYDYERDCNARCIEMLESVPADCRADPQYQKAIDKLAHLVAARRRWLHRLGRLEQAPPIFPQGVTLADLPAQVVATEAAWVAYLAELNDADIDRVVEWQGPDGATFRWEIGEILTQLFGHAWYHRGQIAQLVAGLGGTAVDTDYIFWSGAVPRPALKPAP
jgi:uncharacterized damage-inducible protein DinB